MGPEDQYLKTLKSFFDSAPMLMGIVEISGDDIIHISDNKTAADFFGINQDFMKGKLATELGIPKNAVNEWIIHYTESRKSKRPVHFSYWHQSSEKGIYQHLSATVSFIEIGPNSLPRFSYIVQDTTQQKNTERELRNQEVFLETVLDNIPDMIFVKDAKDLRFLKFNKAGEELIGYTNEELLGKNDFDMFPKSQAEHFTANDRAIIQSRKMLEIPEEPIETKFNGKRVLHTKKIPLYDSDGKPKYLVGISADITEAKQAEEMKQKSYQEQVARKELEKSLRERDEFISIASHELKSPISALKLQAQMFQRKMDHDSNDIFAKERVHQMIDLTEKEVQRLDRLVNDMLDVSRIRTGNLTLQKVDLNLRSLIEEVLSRKKNQFLQSNSGVPEFFYDSNSITGNWDHFRIEQVVVNLLSNAVRYGMGSPIEIRLTHTKDKALIAVHDNGIGIAPENRDKIFNRFERAIERNEVSGLGLGLFISKQIVESHQGKIWVESEPGKGTTFYVELPLHEIKA